MKPIFLFTLFLTLIILGVSFLGGFNFLTSFLEKGTSAVQGVSLEFFRKIPFLSDDLKIKRLKDENLTLLGKIADQEKLRKENAALSDQFKTQNSQNNKLLKAKIIGAPGFVPGISSPQYFILNRGTKDNVKKGQAVLFKDNLVGKISQVSPNLSKVDILTNSFFSFTAQTEKGVVGVVKGKGAELTLDNVLLPDDIKTEEIVFSKGDINSEGIGIPPDLVVGKIVSVEKNPSALFQKAKLQSFIGFNQLSTVFIFVSFE